MAPAKSLLIIEDDEGVRESLQMLLEMEGYQVSTAENGQVALDQLLHGLELPDAILLDLMMPVMDGRTFLATLSKEHPEIFRKIPIIIITASGDPKPALATDLLRKPIELERLLRVIESHTDRFVTDSPQATFRVGT